MELQINFYFILVVGLCSAYPQYAPHGQPSISLVQRVPELGLTPNYHDLVYQYISGMAGNAPPAQVNVIPTRFEDFGNNGGPALPDLGNVEPVTDVPSRTVPPMAASAPLQPSHLLPSDFILLASSPQSQFFGHFDLVKNNKMREYVQNSALPPIGGVMSNYVMQRDIHEKSKSKRQTFAYSHDGFDEDVVINAAVQKAEEGAASAASADTNSTGATSDNKDEPQPSVAQSKPQAIALAGPGGVAQAAPVATAVVGKDGLAIAAPSATAVAGKGAQNALGGGEEKMQKRSENHHSENTKKEAGTRDH